MKKVSTKKLVKVIDEESEGYAEYFQAELNKHFKKIIKLNKVVKLKN